MSASQLKTEKGDICMFAQILFFFLNYFHQLHLPIKFNYYYYYNFFFFKPKKNVCVAMKLCLLLSKTML